MRHTIVLALALWVAAPAWAAPDEDASRVREAVLVAAGDIASCDSAGDEATAALLDGLPGTVATLGDSVYDEGTAEEFAECYDPSWGRHRTRTRPAPGNHEYETSGAAGYFAYFGAAAGDPSEGWYSYELGSWHVVVLNSNCDEIGGCDAGSPQEQWLRADLAGHLAPCTLAYWHHPRFSAGGHGDHASVQPLWEALSEAGVDVVLSGHDHSYQRFAPQGGIREFVVGTGGKGLYEVEDPPATLEAWSDEAHGVLELTLRAKDYAWRFVPVPGGAFQDSGRADCI